MYWLTINRDGINLSELKQDVFPIILARNLLKTLESLQRRSLIEVSISGFTQQPIVMEYMTEKIIHVFQAEIINSPTNSLPTHPMIKAESKNYLRETQVRLILQPILEDLLVTARRKKPDCQTVKEHLRAVTEPRIDRGRIC